MDSNNWQTLCSPPPPQNCAGEVVSRKSPISCKALFHCSAPTMARAVLQYDSPVANNLKYTEYTVSKTTYITYNPRRVEVFTTLSWHFLPSPHLFLPEVFHLLIAHARPRPHANFHAPQLLSTRIGDPQGRYPTAPRHEFESKSWLRILH